MADQGSIDDLLSKEIDQTKVSALIGSLESQLASTAGKESHKTGSGSSFNNNHVCVNASMVNASNIITVAAKLQQQTHVNMQSLGMQSQVIAVNKTIPNNSALINSSVKSSINNPQIIGISSIINANTNTPNRPNSLTNTSIQPLVTNSNPLNSNISPSVRIIMNNTKSPYGISHNNQAQMSNTQSISNMALGGTSKVNIGASGGPTVVHSLATVAGEQKPLNLLPNGSTHLQTVQYKDGSVTPQQLVLKSEANQSVVKRELSPLTKSDVSVSNSVIQALPHSVRQPVPIVSSGPHQIIKGVNADGSPNIVTIRAHTPITEQHLLVRATVATTLANSSPSIQVVSASASGTPSIRPAVTHQIRPGQVRISNQVRIQHTNLAPRQQIPQTITPAQGTLTIPHGALLMRNESGQLVLVSAPQTVLQQTSSSSNSIITSLAPSGCRVQNIRPLGTGPSVPNAGNGQRVVTIQPQVSLQQPTQIRGPTGSTGMPAMTVQHSSGPAAVSGQISVSIGHSTPATVASGALAAAGEMNKAMIENVKKCKNFLSTLIKLAHSQPVETVKNVRALIQGLIDGKVEPEVFTERLQHELQSSPQPYLVPFLKKSLPLLRQSMTKGHMLIEGVKPPSSEITGQAQSIAAHFPPFPAAVNQQRVAATGSLTQRPVMTAQPTCAPAQHLPICPPGPASSKVTAVRQTVPQLAIAPGGNKILVHSISQPQSQLPHSQLPHQNYSGLRMLAQPVPQTIRATRPFISTVVIKQETSSPSAGYREKRKFEALKDGDDDINDVATMGGVNLSEESKNILATTNAAIIGAHIRSCKDEIFLAASPLLKKITAVAKKFGIEEVSPAVVSILSHAAQERLRNMVARLSTIAEHRIEIYKMDARYEIESETKLKLKFVEELDKLEKKRHEELEREKLLRVIKSRSKNEDPEQLKLKQKAKELQQAEAEELRQKEANQTALAAIGPRKKRKLDFLDSSNTGSSASNGLLDSSTNSPMASVMRPRVKRVNMRDVQFLLECEYPSKKSELLFKTFLK